MNSRPVAPPGGLVFIDPQPEPTFGVRSVLITGGTGFLARGLVKRLLADGCERICIYSRNEFSQFQMRRMFDDDCRLRWFIGDVRDKERLEWAMEGVDSVIHAAALKRIEVGASNPIEMVKTNVNGSMNVLEAVRRTGVERVLLVSSDKAFEPISPYGQSKAIAESLFLNASRMLPNGPRFAVVRYGNVFASTGSILPTWRGYVARGEPVPVTDPDCTRFFMRLDEAVALVLDTMRDMEGGEVAVPHLPAYRVGDLAEAMGAAVRVTGLGRHEKKHESMAEGNCSADARRMSVDELKEEISRVTD